MGPAPEGMPDPTLSPPQLARSGDPFTALRVVHFVSRLRRNESLQLRELYGAKGVSGEDEVVAYCRIGERSSHTWFVLHELLGYRNVRNYDGSWTEYGSLVGVPIEVGEASAN